jgi:hypothetical protein
MVVGGVPTVVVVGLLVSLFGEVPQATTLLAKKSAANRCRCMSLDYQVSPYPAGRKEFRPMVPLRIASLLLHAPPSSRRDFRRHHRRCV